MSNFYNAWREWLGLPVWGESLPPITNTRKRKARSRNPRKFGHKTINGKGITARALAKGKRK